MTDPCQTAFEAREDLRCYAHNALLLYALEMRFQLQDIHSVAASALTDSPDDKKCDLVYVDEEGGEIVVAQGFVAQNPDKPSAKANKASDLNTAAAWLLGRSVAELPKSLQSAADEVRAALASKQVRSVQFWYVHNLPQSVNVSAELRTVERTIKAAITATHPHIETPEVAALEVGRETLHEWYESLQNPILVNDELEVEVPGGYPITAEDWAAYATSLPATWLYSLYTKHKSRLFSANVRGYLGSRRSSSNINHAIKMTAQKKPGHFWVFNNGLTALVHNFEAIPAGTVVRLKIKGFSIVNGAQTTGAIGSLDTPPALEAMVQARLVKCSDSGTLHEIIRNNNSQNRIEATDFRSRDPVQERLRKEFENVRDATYTGGRRGGHEDIIRRRADLVPAETCGQALAAFHGDPEIAYHEKSEIWNSNKLYDRYFSEQTTAAHIVFSYGLLRAVEAAKQELVHSRDYNLTQAQAGQLEFFQKRGSILLLTAAVARSVETFLGRAVPNRWRLSFGSQTSPKTSQEKWKPIVGVATSFYDRFSAALKSGLRNRESVQQAFKDFGSMLEAIKVPNKVLFGEFAMTVIEAN